MRSLANLTKEGIFSPRPVFTRMITRIAVVGSCSGQGKTTLARVLAQKIGGTFVEFDSLRNGPNWTIRADEQLRTAIAPVVATERWTIDAIAKATLGRLVATLRSWIYRFRRERAAEAAAISASVRWKLSLACDGEGAETESGPPSRW